MNSAPTIKPVEIFCGTGGVGKTTLSASRALYLGGLGHKVLLITIDPSKRLKTCLGLDGDKLGECQKVVLNNIQIDALLMSPRATLKRMAGADNNSKLMENPIIHILTRAYGGMNEIMAVLEVEYHLTNNYYDTIILDTPPGKHFVDFLKSTQKINKFFDKSFVEIFTYLGKATVKKENDKKNILGILISSGVKKLLSYLEKVTGKSFVGEFVDAIAGLYRSRDSFMRALKLEESFKQAQFCNWFLVTMASHNKYRELEDLAAHGQEFMHSDMYLLLNKSIRNELESWQIQTHALGYKLKETMIQNQEKIILNAQKTFHTIYEFPEIPSASPKAHVEQLIQVWRSL